jgi:hypothetical protein
MNYANFALYGYIILFIIYLYYLKINLKENTNIIIGSLLVIFGYLFAILETYNYIKKKSVSKISKSHIILGVFLLLSFILPINTHSKKTDIFGVIGHLLLINPNFGYSGVANICLTIYYSLYTYRNARHNDTVERMQAVGGGLILLYYIKKSIDKFYTKKEEKYKIESK